MTINRAGRRRPGRLSGDDDFGPIGRSRRDRRVATITKRPSVRPICPICQEVCLNTADDGLRDDSWTPTGRDALTENLSDDSRHTGVTRSISSSPFLLIRNSGLHRLGSGRGRLNGRLRLGGRNSRSGDLRGRDGVPLAYNLRVLDLRLAPRAVIDEQHRDQARGRNRGCDQRRAK